MNKKSEKLLRKIYSIDTEAGHRFRYHVMRAEACSEYAEEISFNERDNLISSFVWARTLEGHKYWKKIFDLRRLHEPYSSVLDRYEDNN